MKQPKKLSYSEKVIVAKAGLDPKEWMLQSTYEGGFVIINKITGETRRMDT